MNSNSLFIRTAVALCGLASAGSLRADGEVFLKNGTGQKLVINRVPSSAGQTGKLQGSIHKGPAFLKTLDGSFHPPAGACLELEPGATAMLAWKGAPPRSGIAHLRVRMGGDGRRCFLSYLVSGPEGKAEGRLEPYREFGPLAGLEVGKDNGTDLHTLTGIRSSGQESKALRESEHFLKAIDQELFPEQHGASPWTARTAGPGVTGVLTRTRKLAVRALPNAPAVDGKAGAVLAAHAKVILSNLSEQDLFLTWPKPSKAAGDPGLVMSLFDESKKSEEPTWHRVAPSPWSGARLKERIPAGRTALIGLAEEPAHGHKAVLALEMEGDDRTCYLQYQVAPDGKARLEPCREHDQALLGEAGGSDTLVVLAFHDPDEGDEGDEAASPLLTAGTSLES